MNSFREFKSDARVAIDDGVEACLLPVKRYSRYQSMRLVGTGEPTTLIGSFCPSSWGCNGAPFVSRLTTFDDRN